MRRAILLLTVLAATLVVASGVALAVTSQGGPGNDLVLGTDGTDELGGGYGSDTIMGLGGKDYLYGGDLWPPGSEAPPPEVGPNNDDIMTGGTDNDVLWANMGSDRIVGGTGDDILLDGESAGGAYDILIGGTGNEVLDPRNKPAGKDLAVCGAGMDIAYVDKADIVIGCERVRFRHPTDAQWQRYYKERGL
jgi:Ca2+-binding RTX toxin-like protein